MDSNNPTGANPAPTENQPSVPAPEPAQPSESAQSTPVNPVPPVQPAVPEGKKSNSAVIIIVVIFIVAVLLFGGIIVLAMIAPWKAIADLDGGDNGGSSVVDPTPASKGNCKFYECLTKVTKDSTKEEVEAAFGFAPEAEINEEKETEKYTWVFDEEHTIVMNVSTFLNKKTTVNIQLGEYNKDELKQKGVTFDNVSEIKANLNKDDGVSYEEFKEYMGGVDGILTEVGSWNKYEWRSADNDGYMSGSFSSDGKCMFMSGITY